MTIAAKRVTQSMTLLSVALLGLSACELDTRALGWPNTVSPQQYCPGDTVTSSYDFLAGLTCAADVDCTLHFPNVDFSSNPASFPPQRITGYAGGVSFMPTADAVDISLTIDRDEVRIPTDEVGEHGRITVVRPINTRSTTRRVTRINDSTEESQTYGGFCVGMSHAYGPVTIAALPRFSPRLVLTEICNTSSLPIFVAPFAEADRELPLAIGECAAITDGALAGATIRARPQFMDPLARCSPLDGGTPPRALQTRAQLACR